MDARVHTMFPKPLIVDGCCAFASTIKWMHCNFIENKYHSDRASSSSNILNWLVTISPVSQNTKLSANDQNKIFTVFTLSFNSSNVIDVSIEES